MPHTVTFVINGVRPRYPLNRCTSENIQHTTLLNSLVFQKDFSYNIIGSRTNLTLELDGNTYCTTYDYDMLERLSNIVCSITSLNPISANYAYNPNGKLSGLTQRRNGAKVAEMYTNNKMILRQNNMVLGCWNPARDFSPASGGIAGLGEAGSLSTDTYFYALANKLIARDETIQFDNDGLDVSEELYNGTDPCDSDTDNDGWTDNYEIKTSNTNPWDPDTDGDRTVDGNDAQPFIPNSGLWFGATTSQPAQPWWTNSPSKPVYDHQAQATHKYYYDIAGNLASNIENGEVVYYYYNAQNKLTKIQGSGFTYEFIYDSQNRRVGIKKGSQWLYDVHDGTIPIARMNTNGTLSNYFVRGVGIAEGTGDIIAEINNSGTVKYYVSNHRGDTVECLSDNGSVITHIQYDAFGNIVTNIGSFSPLYSFSTKEHLPEINAMLYAYRIYLIDCGRWTQRDPIDYQDSVNLYQFCGNNPMNCWDSNGCRWDNGNYFNDDEFWGHAGDLELSFGNYFYDNVEYWMGEAGKALPENLAGGISANGSWIYPDANGNTHGDVVGINRMSFVTGGKSKGRDFTYVSFPYKNHGLDVGVAIESVWALGKGKWVGEFISYYGTVGIITFSYFTSSDGSWKGITLGLGIGVPIGFAREVTYYDHYE